MTNIPYLIERRFKASLVEAAVSKEEGGFLLRWLKEYFAHCARRGVSVRDASSGERFVGMLAENGVEGFRCEQAREAVLRYREVMAAEGETLSGLDGYEAGRIEREWEGAVQGLVEAIGVRQYSANTRRTYVTWVRRFQSFVRGKGVDAVVAGDAAEFFTHLACVKRVSASTQNQAFSALLFFFRHVLKREFKGFEGVVRPRRTKYIPVVLSREEVDRVFGELRHPFDLLVRLMYGCGLRLFEVVNLRVGCLNFDGGVLTVHDGKGRKDRTVPLPRCLREDLERQVGRVRFQLGRDLEAGFAGVFMPAAYERKFRSGARELPWQWLFPARRLTLVLETREWRRYHAHEKKVGVAIRDASRVAGMAKRVTAHTFRHSYASHLLEANFDIRTIQELLGHSSLETTMIYTHTLRSRGRRAAESPLDF